VSKQTEPNSSPAAAATRVILDEDDEIGDVSQRGGFVGPGRGREYYFTDAVGPARARERRGEFEAVAVSGEEVRRGMEVRYSGWEVRWRVRHLREWNGELVGVGGEEGERGGAKPLVGGLEERNWRGGSGMGEGGRGGKKGKPGKKRRIVLRMRKRRADEAAERKREEKERKVKEVREREEAEREKRTRRNREKKVKKKMREKEKKTIKVGDGRLGTKARDESSEGE
jgi:hypothetical protein